jgi:hypothetical protein
MQTKNGNIHLEIQTSRKSPVGILRNTFWDKVKKRATAHPAWSHYRLHRQAVKDASAGI